MKSNGVSTNLGKIATMIADQPDGTDAISDDGLENIFREMGVYRSRKYYLINLLTHGYIEWDHKDRIYRLTEEGKASCTITITVSPRLNAEEVRGHLVDALSAYSPVIKVGDVNVPEEHI